MTLCWGLVQVLLLVLAALGLGHLLTGRARLLSSALGEQSLRFVLGLGGVILLTIAAGWLELWGRWFHHALLLGGSLLWLARAKESPLRGTRPSPRATVTAAVILAIPLFYAAFPPTFYDALLYHLGLPGLYLQAGRFVHWPECFFSALPQNGEMLNLLLLSGGSVHGPKFLSLAAGLAVFLFLSDWARSEGNLSRSWLPGLIFFSIPEVAFLAVTEKNDLPMMLFLLPGVRLLALMEREPFRWRTPVVTGLLFGLGVGVKWQGAIVCAGFMLATLLTSRQPWRVRLRQLAICGAIVVLAISPWLAKNLAAFGNPFHPYLGSLFPEPGWSADQASQLDEGLRRGQGFGPLQILGFLYHLFLSPYRLGLTHLMGVLVLLLLPLLFLSRRRFPSSPLLLTGTGIGAVLMLLGARVPRYFLPLFLVLSLPLASACENLLRRFPTYRRIALALLFTLAGIQGIQAISLLERMTRGGRYVLGKVSGSLPAGVEYLDTIPYYPAVRFINRHLPPTAKIAILGEERTFYLERPFVAASSFDRNPLLEDLRATRTAREWPFLLKKRGATHLLYSPSGLTRMAKHHPLYRLSGEEADRLSRALRGLTLLYRDERCLLYELPSR